MGMQKEKSTKGNPNLVRFKCHRQGFGDRQVSRRDTKGAETRLSKRGTESSEQKDDEVHRHPKTNIYGVPQEYSTQGRATRRVPTGTKSALNRNHGHRQLPTHAGHRQWEYARTTILT